MADKCEKCRWWEAKSSTQSKADCGKTGKYKSYDDDCDCGKFSRA